jgi:hypothetical protein
MIKEYAKQENSMKQTANTNCLLHTGFLIRMLFEPEDESDTILRNVI